MRVRLVVALVLVTAALPVAVATASTPAQRHAGALAFSRISRDADRALDAGDGPARQAAQARRVAAGGCLDAWGSAPLTRREDLGDLYFEAIGGGLWAVDGPIFRRWVLRLERAPSIARVPVLAATVRALRRDLTASDRIWTAFPEPCRDVLAWRDAGWAVESTPARLVESHRILDAPSPEPRGLGLMELAANLLQHETGPASGPAQALLYRSFDEPDIRIFADTRDCDPVATLVLDDGRCYSQDG